MIFKYLLLVVLLIKTSRSTSLYKTDTSKFFDYFNYDMSTHVSVQTHHKQAELTTCFTCAKSQSNEDCNRKAIDEPCAHSDEVDSLRACLTVHQFNAHSLETFYIEKKCITKCSPDLVGCQTQVKMSKSSKKHVHVRTCSYCCSKSYCNLDSVLSEEQALNRTDINSASFNSANSIRSSLNYILFLIVFLVL